MTTMMAYGETRQNNNPPPLTTPRVGRHSGIDIVVSSPTIILDDSQIPLLALTSTATTPPTYLYPDFDVDPESYYSKDGKGEYAHSTVGTGPRSSLRVKTGAGLEAFRQN